MKETKYKSNHHKKKKKILGGGGGGGGGGVLDQSIGRRVRVNQYFLYFTF